MSIEREYEIVLRPELESGFSGLCARVAECRLRAGPSRPTSKWCTKTAFPSRSSTAAAPLSTRP